MIYVLILNAVYKDKTYSHLLSKVVWKESTYFSMLNANISAVSITAESHG